jgi:hypothetical protein
LSKNLLGIIPDIFCKRVYISHASIIILSDTPLILDKIVKHRMALFIIVSISASPWCLRVATIRLGIFLSILIARSLIISCLQGLVNAVDGSIAETGNRTIRNNTTSQMPPLNCQLTHRPRFLNMCLSMGSALHLHRIGDPIAVVCHSPHRAYGRSPARCEFLSPLSAVASAQ